MQDGTKAIKRAWRRYVEVRASGSPTAGREHLEEIQHIVDLVGKRFVFKIPQPDGVPAKLEFLPAWMRGPLIGDAPASVPIIAPPSA